MEKTEFKVHVVVVTDLAKRLTKEKNNFDSRKAKLVGKLYLNYWLPLSHLYFL